MKMRSVFVLLGLVLLPMSGFAEKEVGNGGGGVVKNGTYMTFYSAGLYVDPISPSQVPIRIPAIQKLTQYFTAIQYLSLKSKSPFLMAIQPTTKRQYMIATPELLTPAIKARLLAEFQRVTKVDPSNLELFAITDTGQQITYLLPGFEKLSLNDQMAILFHESYWIIHPDATYNNVVNAEMAFEAALAEPSNMAAVYDFVGYLGDSKESLSAKMKWELASENLKGFVNDRGQFTLGKLLGEDYFACIRSMGGRQSSENAYPFGRVSRDRDQLITNQDLCAPYFRAHLNDLIAQYPRSLVFRDVAKNFDASKSLLLVPYSAQFEKSNFNIFGGFSGRSVGCYNAGEEIRGEDAEGYETIHYDWDIESLASCVVTLSGDDLNTQCSDYSLTAAQMFYSGQSIHTFQCVGKSLSLYTAL